MFLLMGVSLYTSRVILKELGVDDYGIYSLIAGFISIFAVISNALESVVQRFFYIAIGDDDNTAYSRYYSMSINLFVIFVLLIVIVGEAIGPWFIKTQLNIPSGREAAAMGVYHFAILTMVVAFFRTPYSATIIAHEKMGFYAWLSIVEAFLKLVIVFLLHVSSYDKLVAYAGYYFFVTFLVNVIYSVYCHRNYPSCRFRFQWDGSLFRQMFSFSGWTLLSQSSRMGKTQCENFFINSYYSVAINASRGIAIQVYNAINSFLFNFQLAFNPQLVKSYSAGEMEDHYTLVYKSAKLSYFLLMTLTIPMVFNMDGLLKIWLEDVPLYTKDFCVYVLIAYLADALASPLMMSVNANGNIKYYQLWITTLFVFSTICSCFLLAHHVVPYVVSVITMIAHIIMLIITLYYAKVLCGISIVKYSRNVLLPVIAVSFLSLTVPFLIHNIPQDAISTIVVVMVDVAWSLAVALMIGMDRTERRMLWQAIRLQTIPE